MIRDEEKLISYFSQPPEDISLSDIDLNAIPRHVSFIMDGNGRWATSRGLDRSLGHRAGVDALRETITCGVRLGLDVLSAYAFSTENWKRSKREVELLMSLFAKTMLNELPLFHQEHVRLRLLGNLDALPPKVRASFDQGLKETEGYDRMVLALAVNYGARDEITRAARLLAQEVAEGRRDAAHISPEDVSSHLYTHDLPDPELVVRTSGELRVSNYLLWQIAYSEFYVTDLYWPDFNRWEMLRAIRSFQRRERRFGGVNG